MRVVTVLGARPQFIKAAATSRAFRDTGIEELILHTGQHYDRGMSQGFFEEYGIPNPWRNLAVGSGPAPAQTGAMLAGVADALIEAAPDVVVVPGDTTSTLAGALAAVQLNVPLAHIEAGLRSFVRSMPEERNRVISDHLADVLYAPSASAMRWLADEGLADRAVLVGDVMRDVVDRVVQPPSDRSNLVLATVHRPRNADDPARLGAIVGALRSLAADNIHVVLPVHPRTRRILAQINTESLDLVDPLPHAKLLDLASRARAVVTDSGGLQKEAYWLRTPCVTLRAETEWRETVDEGWNTLVDAEESSIIQAVRNAATPTTAPDAYGAPGAAGRIAADLLARFS